ncbi:sugar nucleotide-binding protein [Winogradskyella echinorum]|uniref:dTDP-4-dehydrorhamnose reductase n=1 Tax=Winogradskyella echinorum TaxID=538189 RepID=A0ABR6Y103_9FLAO|nr:sugar nucleotide-binding protein [Winogradskyella echinorum]MBC3846412.1 sugar nucleotide-binding protein [Winogradskyella echinorum]MBC5750760.1 sugar nucleotide-binding protein [Winogradskyella echinorum]
MKKDLNKHRVLILGASGYLGNAIYKELGPYFRTYGTYRTPKKEYEKNKQFFHYNVEQDDVYEILEACKPSIIISALRGDFNAQTIAHQHIAEFALEFGTKVIFISSANAFDAYSKYPSYELDKTLSHSIYGHFKIKIENMLLRLPKKQVAILRLPMVFGANCPRILEIKQLISNKESVEIFPNLIMNVTLDKKVTQQIHYIINRNKYGIFHLGSTDLVHHDEFIKHIIAFISEGKVQLKHVFTTNEDRYLAVLPKYNKLPKHLQITSHKVLEELQK